MRVSHDLLQRAGWGVYVLYPASDVPTLSHINLPLFSLFVAARRDARVSGHKRSHAAVIRKLHAFTAEVHGAVYGTFLGSVVAAAAVRKSRTAYVVRTIKALLTPVAAAASTIQGVDGRALCRGLASSRASPAQVAATSTAYVPVRLHSHLGHANTVIGACASVFAVFGVLLSPLLGSASASQLESDARDMLENDALRVTLYSVIAALQRCVPSQGYAAALPQEEVAADAEERAAKRALCGVSRAYERAARSCTALQTMRLALDWFAKAAWPAGQLLNERTHDAVIALLDTNFFLRPPEAGPLRRECGIVPLAELQHADGALVSDSDASSVGTYSTGSGGSSVAGDGR